MDIPQYLKFVSCFTGPEISGHSERAIRKSVMKNEEVRQVENIEHHFEDELEVLEILLLDCSVVV